MPWSPSRHGLLCCLTRSHCVNVLWTYCERTPTNHRSQSWLILTAVTRRASTRHVNYQISMAAVVLPNPFQLLITLRTSWPSRRTVPAHGIAFRCSAFPLPVLRIPNRIPPLYINHPKALAFSEVYRYQHYIWTDRPRRRYAIGWSITYRRRCESKHGTAFCN